MTTYEWTIELIDYAGDIVDSDFSDTLKGLPKITATPGNKTEVGLVRNSGNDIDGLTDRLWAYVKDGKLPEYFLDATNSQTGYKVPQKFHKELVKHSHPVS